MDSISIKSAKTSILTSSLTILGYIFALFAATFDVGIVTMPYIAAENGILFTILLITS